MSERGEVLNSGVVDGVRWEVCRAPLYGAVNGYVELPEDHPYGGMVYDAMPLEVHGGLTYQSGSWIGFDTLHSGDYWPGLPESRKRLFEGEGATRWTQEMVEEEAKDLARQVSRAMGWKLFYVSFGQRYRVDRHPVYGYKHRLPDLLLQVAARDREHARDVVIGLLGMSWAFIYSAEEMRDLLDKGHAEGFFQHEDFAL